MIKKLIIFFTMFPTITFIHVFSDKCTLDNCNRNWNVHVFIYYSNPLSIYIEMYTYVFIIIYTSNNKIQN